MDGWQIRHQCEWKSNLIQQMSNAYITLEFTWRVGQLGRPRDATELRLKGFFSSSLLSHVGLICWRFASRTRFLK